MKRTALKRKPWRRALGTAEQRLRFKQAVLEADGGCLMLGIKLCDGPLQAAHVVPKQRLRRDGYGADVIYSPEAAVTLCRKHHEQWDRGFLPHVDALLPQRCREFVKANRGRALRKEYGMSTTKATLVTTAGSRLSNELLTRQRTCQECGMLLDDAGEFHPSAFCVLKKAGRDPWGELVWMNERLGVDVSHWPKRPPLVRNLPAYDVFRQDSATAEATKGDPA